MRTYAEGKWRELGNKMVEISGVSSEDARTITDILVSGSLRGIDSHGVRVFPRFTEKRRKAEMKVLKEMQSRNSKRVQNLDRPLNFPVSSPLLKRSYCVTLAPRLRRRSRKHKSWTISRAARTMMIVQLKRLKIVCPLNWRKQIGL